MLDANSPEFARRVDTLTKVVNKNIQMIDSDPVIVIPVLMRLLCVTIVSEMGNNVFSLGMTWRSVRANSFSAFKRSLDDAIEKMKAVHSSLPSNDESSDDN